MPKSTQSKGGSAAGTTSQVVEALRKLRETRLFSTVGSDLLEEAVAGSLLRSEPSGTVLCREGEYADTLFVIITGSVEVGVATSSQDYVMLALMEAGDVFGEMAVLSGNPRSATVLAHGPVTVLELPRLVLQDLMKKSEGFKAALEKIQAEHTVDNVVRRTPLLANLDEGTLNQLLKNVRFRAFKPDEVVFNEGDDGDSLYIVRSGFVKVTKRYEGKERVLAYHTTGSFFGEMALLEGGARTATVTAFTSVETIQITADDFRHLREQSAKFKATVAKAAEERRSATAAVEQDPSRTLLLEELVSRGALQAGKLLVINLNTCIGCDNCVEACRSRHGEARLDRHGTRIASVNLPVACHLCQDPVCLLCPYDGIRRAPTGEVYITDNCIGCTGCVRRCPYDVIKMRELEPEIDEEEGGAAGFIARLLRLGPSGIPTPSQESEKGGETQKGKVHRRAVKCDTCLGYGNQACVDNCPVHAIEWVDPREFFREPDKVLKPVAIGNETWRPRE